MKPLLVDAEVLRELLGYSMSAIKTANKFYGFPCPVVKISNRYQWRLSDVEKWVEKMPFAFDDCGFPTDKLQSVTQDAFVSNMRIR